MLSLIDILSRADVVISISKSDEGEYAITITGCPLVFVDKDLDAAARAANNGLFFYEIEK